MDISLEELDFSPGSGPWALARAGVRRTPFERKQVPLLLQSLQIALDGPVNAAPRAGFAGIGAAHREPRRVACSFAGACATPSRGEWWSEAMGAAWIVACSCDAGGVGDEPDHAETPAAPAANDAPW